MSYPGSEHQIWHTDTSYGFGDASLISIGIALTDIDKTMGPLNVYKGSNNMYTEDIDDLYTDHNIETESCSEEEEGLCSQPIEKICKEKGYKLTKCVAKKGDLVAWQSSVVHRGSANKSNKLRPVFYFSLMSAFGNEPYGSTYSTTDDRIHVKQL
jgi:ectoine hydroxylase-related dioxygenase (phytanoyl-CoA dioxygenase family)